MVTDPSVVLFDFFGTLVTYEPDRTRLTYLASHRLASELGYRHDHDRFVIEWDAASSRLEEASAGSHVEYSMTDAARAFAAHCGLELDAESIADLGSCFVREWQDHVVPVPGAAEMVRRLSTDRRVGIVSNTHDPRMVPVLVASMGLAESMSVVMLSVDHGLRKPHPSIYTTTLALLGVSPAEVVFVGDSYVPDYAAPRALGMRALLITDDVSIVPHAHRLASVTGTEAALGLAR